MDNKFIYIVTILDGISFQRQLLRVLFYYDEIEAWGEPDSQEELQNAFMEKYWDKKANVVCIEKSDLDYFAVIS